MARVVGIGHQNFEQLIQAGCGAMICYCRLMGGFRADFP